MNFLRDTELRTGTQKSNLSIDASAGETTAGEATVGATPASWDERAVTAVASLPCSCVDNRERVGGASGASSWLLPKRLRPVAVAGDWQEGRHK